MASTDTRPGFRLPWSSDARSPQDHASGEADETAPATEPEQVSANDADPAGDDPSAPAPEAGAPGFGAPLAGPAADTHMAPAGHRPTKFLADLARAMRSTAETERQEILERFGSEAKQFIVGIHEHSAGEAAELRSAADHDIAGIRDWSKAEIARVREETDRRVTERRARLEGEVQAHAARIERQVASVQRTVGAFESQMAEFFEALLAEEDPSHFAQLASNLPEPPSLEDVAWSAEYLVDPWLEPAGEPVVAEAPAVPESAAAGPVADEVAEPAAEAAELTTDAVEPATEEPAADISFEAAEAAEPAEPAFAEVDGGEAPEVEATEVEATEAEATEVEATEVEATEAEATEVEVTEPGTEAEPAEVPGGSAPPFDDDSLTFDPRVTALGLTPDFGAAEAEAAAAVDEDITDDGSGEAIPAIDEATIAARLAGLVPPEGGPADSAETRVVVSGLVSVASIAGFKRSLARVPGVHSVSVSSGPDGEFVFAVNHAGGVDLPGHVATLSGFSARVTGTADGTLAVVAHDPDAND